MTDSNADIEIVDRLTRSLSVCRTCAHVLMSHIFIGLKKIKYCVDAFVNELGEYKKCSCEQFIPKDNLEYLEWAQQNKEKEK